MFRFSMRLEMNLSVELSAVANAERSTYQSFQNQNAVDKTCPIIWQYTGISNPDSYTAVWVSNADSY